MPLKRYHHGNLRSTILQAARTALRTLPPEELSLRHLARDANVSANAPYRHFADRNALLSVLAADGFQVLTNQVRAKAAAASPPRKLAAMADAYLAFAREEPGQFRLMFRPHTSATRSVELSEALEGLFAEIVAVLDAITPQQDAEASLKMAVGTWATMHGSTMLALDGTLDWLDLWLRPTGADLITTMLRGFEQTLSGPGGAS